MSFFIDYDDPETFPTCLGELNSDFAYKVRSGVSLENVQEWWQIERQLQDLHIADSAIVKEFVNGNMDAEVAVCHCTRIIDVNQYWKEGLVTGGRGSVVEKRLRKLLQDIGLNNRAIEDIFLHVYNYWDRDQTSRTHSVHFVIDKSFVYKDGTVSYFASSLGGEILRWSIEAIDKELHKREPYKRLWIWGTPSIVKFKCKLSDIHYTVRYALIAEIVKFYIVTRMFDYPYEFKLTGMTIGSVPPENIISIEEIENFNAMQAKYCDFKQFQDDNEN